MSEPGEDHLLAEQALLERIRSALPDGVVAQPAVPTYDDLLDPPGPEPFAAEPPKSIERLISPEDHWARLHAVRDRLDRAGASGTGEVLRVPAGWVRLMEGLAEGISPLLEAEPGAQLHIGQIKEKFGTLRVYATMDGSDRFRSAAREVILWATAASGQRCALTGRSGIPDPAGWFLILSPEAISWRRSQPDAFRSAIYPASPKAEPDAPEP